MPDFSLKFDTLVIPKPIKKDIDNDSKLTTIRTRFPPAPSGYLHIGHAKALHLNASIAKHYKGELILRFDDTNPETDSLEYHDAILQDLTSLGCDTSKISYISDYFDKLIEIATQLVSNGIAYVDFSTDINQQRITLTASKYRDTSPEENLILWKDMINGTITDACLRFKINYAHSNSAMRDPVMYRHMDYMHFRTGNKYKVYPSYDYSCPIVDSLQGITHVFRSTEYTERKDQTIFILKKLNMAIPRIYHYGRISIAGAELSKRKIKQGIIDGKYTDWYDHRLYTVRAIQNRGIDGTGLENFLVDIGYSVAPAEIQAHRLLCNSNRSIDEQATRCIALPLNYVIVPLEISSDDNITLPATKTFDCFARNPELGKRNVTISSNIAIKKVDYDVLKEGDEITLTHFGNAFYKNGKFVSHFAGDPKKTELKVIWIDGDEIGKYKLEILTLNSDGTKTISTYWGEKWITNIPVGKYLYLNQMRNYLVTDNDGHNVGLLEIEK